MIDLFSGIKYSKALKDNDYGEVSKEVYASAENVLLSLSSFYNLHLNRYWYTKFSGGLILFFDYQKESKCLIVEISPEKTVKAFVHDDTSNEVLAVEHIRDYNFAEIVKILKE